MSTRLWLIRFQGGPEDGLSMHGVFPDGPWPAPEFLLARRDVPAIVECSHESMAAVRGEAEAYKLDRVNRFHWVAEYVYDGRRKL